MLAQCVSTLVPKGPLSCLFTEYRPISITPVMSKVFEKLVTVRLQRYLEACAHLPSCHFVYGKKLLGTCDALLTICQMGQKALEDGGELFLVQVDFSATFDRLNHTGFLHKLRSVSVGGSVLNIIEHFLANRTQRVVIDGVARISVPVISGVPQGSVLGPLLFLVYTSELSEILENTLVTYADNSTLLATVPSPAERVNLGESLNRDLTRISECCMRLGMLVNAIKTKAMVVSRTLTALPRFPPLLLDGRVLACEDMLRILGVNVDCKLTFESHLRAVAASAAQKLGIMRRAWSVFRDVDLIRRCFWSFILPVLEYCSPVWASAAESHLALLDRVVRNAAFMCPDIARRDLEHRRGVACLCKYYKIRENTSIPLITGCPILLFPRVIHVKL